MISTTVDHMRARTEFYDVAIVGGGPAGCAAALAARAAGAARVLLVDLANGPGGALAAMGLSHLHETDTRLAEAGVLASYQTTLLNISAELKLRLLSPHGLRHAFTRAVVLATGGREQTRGNLGLPGTRPAGVLTAGAVLRLLATTGRRPGRRIVVAGGGRWAQTAAHLLEQAGASILAVVQSVAQIEGWPRISSVVHADGRRQACDLLVLATPQVAWRPPVLSGARAPGGVFIAGAAHQAELDAAAAAADGAAAGERAAYAARVKS
jgi:hypothetical protein